MAQANLIEQFISHVRIQLLQFFILLKGGISVVYHKISDCTCSLSLSLPVSRASASLISGFNLFREEQYQQCFAASADVNFREFLLLFLSSSNTPFITPLSVKIPPLQQRTELPKTHPSAARPSYVMKTRRFPSPDCSGFGFLGHTGYGQISLTTKTFSCQYTGLSLYRG